MPRPAITADLVRSFYGYDPATGYLTYRARARLRCDVGDRAGSSTHHGYRQIKVAGWTFQEHRIAWMHHYGCFPEDHIDHINGIKSDNRLVNLRLATISQNNRNRGPYQRNTAGYKGVTWHKQRKRWQAACWANGKQNYLGLFETAEDASKAYVDYAKEHHGEFFHM